MNSSVRQSLVLSNLLHVIKENSTVTVKQECSRLNWINLDALEAVDQADDLIAGLKQTPKTLPCRYLYDDRGSALFEKICDLPEYYPTRTEQAILEQNASAIAQMTGSCELIELGSGSSRKTHLLLEAYSQTDQSLSYCPVDVSTGLLRTTALQLLHHYPTLQVCGLAGTYEQALAQLPPATRRRMLIFLGSTLGNLNPQDCDRFLTQVQSALQPGDFFLVGVDLQKDVDLIETAYNDAQGVTAAFNLNALKHLNQQFEGNFRLNQFAHWAFYNPVDHQIEMHLFNLRPQFIFLRTLNFAIELQIGETIRTEISRKFYLPTLISTLERHDLRSLQVWTDPNRWFALLLCQRQA
ncbi:L-histidine N(alpha)-methyltransferase [Phormidesmis priestleyi ULC007]|uniref:L-histidine N(Alpha)-methyltransferase n=1 Tax=Phormidesmis priestleyi ULC007 TaxID=1920490 RepID=A0A2T1D5G3_9CYAN|nr:L-histidine N(alpha)-methyltransferase [Phormidesmis priestleyi ULC007]PZO48371.1 MAG: L-histidine N(alpha)-methyltransferase [Phormidesmis priestleyi]